MSIVTDESRKNFNELIRKKNAQQLGLSESASWAEINQMISLQYKQYRNDQAVRLTSHRTVTELPRYPRLVFAAT